MTETELSASTKDGFSIKYLINKITEQDLIH
jgi:hypothetical protein